MPDDLIKKSIRLPADLDEYVNSQKGTTWTDKLCRILEDYRSGDETRAVYMADYEKRMAANRKKIQEIICTVPLKTLTPCPSRNPGVCLSSGTWNTGTAALVVRICRESRFTDPLPRHFPARGTGAALAAVSLRPHGSDNGSRDESLVASGARPAPRRGTRTAADPEQKGMLMFIKVEQVICGEIERWIFIDPRTIHVEADRSVSDLSRIVYFMYARSKSEGKVIVRTSSDAAELLDLRDTYWKQVEKHK